MNHEVCFGFGYLLEGVGGAGWLAGMWHTLGEIEVGYGNHVTLADIIIAAVLLERGLEGFRCLLLIEDRILVDVGQRVAVPRTPRLPLHQRVAHAELYGRLNVSGPLLHT